MNARHLIPVSSDMKVLECNNKKSQIGEWQNCLSIVINEELKILSTYTSLPHFDLGYLIFKDRQEKKTVSDRILSKIDRGAKGMPNKDFKKLVKLQKPLIEDSDGAFQSALILIEEMSCFEAQANTSNSLKCFCKEKQFC